MKNIKKTTLLAVILTAGLCLAGCEGEETKTVIIYTEQTAQAIVKAGENIGTCIILAALMRGILNK